MQEVLKIASLIGYSFAKSVLVNVASVVLDAKKLTSEEPAVLTGAELVESMMARAVSEGFIETTKDVCHFTHDKLHASFLCPRRAC
jgi:UDP-N-acetyl-D-mannosaminuronic acid transferase (WecB/TagA/CpsF family)